MGCCAQMQGNSRCCRSSRVCGRSRALLPCWRRVTFAGGAEHAAAVFCSSRTRDCSSNIWNTLPCIWNTLPSRLYWQLYGRHSSGTAAADTYNTLLGWHQIVACRTMRRESVSWQQSCWTRCGLGAGQVAVKLLCSRRHLGADCCLLPQRCCLCHQVAEPHQSAHSLLCCPLLCSTRQRTRSASFSCVCCSSRPRIQKPSRQARGHVLPRLDRAPACLPWCCQ